LYTHQKEKVIVFVANCELANFLQKLMLQMDWNEVGRRADGGDNGVVDLTATKKTGNE
jgi:hypothetical protein